MIGALFFTQLLNITRDQQEAHKTLLYCWWIHRVLPSRHIVPSQCVQMCAH